MKRTLLLSFLFLVLGAAQLLAQQKADVADDLSASVFGDYYWMAQNHNNNLQNSNGFRFRRIYLTYEHDITQSFSGRLRLGVNSDGSLNSGTQFEPYVKDAYVKWQGARNRHQIRAGISATPTWQVTEDVWQYRSVEKTPLDLFGFGSSRDFGLSFKGFIDKNKNLQYNFFVGNGNGTRTDFDRGKKLMLALSYYIGNHFVVQGYADWNNATNGLDRYTGQLMVGFQSDKVNVGALAAYQDTQPLGNIEDVPIDLASFFINFDLDDYVRGYLRADHLFGVYNGGSNNDYIPFAESGRPTIIMGGFDFYVNEYLHLLPNVETIIYNEDNFGLAPEPDIMPRLTFSFRF